MVFSLFFVGVMIEINGGFIIKMINFVNRIHLVKIDNYKICNIGN